MRVEVDGQIYDVPDDATPEEIDQITQPKPQAPQHGRFSEALHQTAQHLPMAGGIVGGALGVGLGLPGGPLGSAAGGALGAGLLGAAGGGLRDAVDSALGYENAPPTIQELKRAGGAGLTEAAGAGLGGLAAEGATALGRSVTGPLREMAQNATRRILRNTGGSIAASKALNPDVLQEVLDVGAIKPFGTSSGTAERIAAARESAGERYSEIVDRLAQKGLDMAPVSRLANQYAQKSAQVNANTANDAVTDVYGRLAESLPTKATADRMSLVQAENIKRSLQDQAKSAYKQMQPGELASAHEDAASMMRQAIEDTIEAQAIKNRAARRDAELQELVAQFEPVKQQAGRLIAAGNVANEGMARAANRNGFSPYDIAAGSAELARTGNPVAAGAGAILMRLLRERGPSTAAWSANALANQLEEPGVGIGTRLMAGTGAAVAPRLSALLEALRQNRSEANAP